MGLNFKDSDAQWSYSGFMNFRCRMWTVLGFPGELREIYYGTSDIKLDIAKKHPIYQFLNHSDCEGTIGTRNLKKILPTLKEVLVKFKAQNYGVYDHDVEALDKLIKTIEKNIIDGKPLVFC